MLNEGILTNSTVTLMKSTMLDVLNEDAAFTPDEWERAVFYRLTGNQREDIDFEAEGQAQAYRAWLRSFDQLIGELLEDGYIREEPVADGVVGRQLVANEGDESIGVSQAVYPSG